MKQVEECGARRIIDEAARRRLVLTRRFWRTGGGGLPRNQRSVTRAPIADE